MLNRIVILAAYRNKILRLRTAYCAQDDSVEIQKNGPDPKADRGR